MFRAQGLGLGLRASGLGLRAGFKVMVVLGPLVTCLAEDCRAQCDSASYHRSHKKLEYKCAPYRIIAM